MKFFAATCVPKLLSFFLVSLILIGCAEEPSIDLTEPHSKYIVKPKRAYEYPIHPLTGTYAHSAAVKQFIQHMTNAHAFDEGYLNDLFSQAHRLNYVIRLEGVPHSTRPKSNKPSIGGWSRYRKQFLTEGHIEKGVDFWLENSDAIQRASQTYNVDPEYIVAIIGVETYFGRNFGTTCTFDALTTLAFDTHRRSNFFKEELENFLLMSREEGYQPNEPLGSWAGAMGFGQFMPSSFRRLAVDFNKDGHRNLWHPSDAIGSVAHYFSHHGWKFQQSVAEQTSDDSDPATITLGSHNGYEFWQTYPNFNVIKKYNNSNKYAMAVHQLAQAIKLRYNGL